LVVHGKPWVSRHDIGNHRLIAPGAGNHKVFVKGRLERTCVETRRTVLVFFDVVRHTDARFRLFSDT